MELPDLRKYSTREHLDLVDLFVGTVGWREDRELTKVAACGNETRTFVDSQTPGAQANVLMQESMRVRSIYRDMVRLGTYGLMISPLAPRIMPLIM